MAEDIQGGLNEDSHNGEVASAKISSGEEASCEEGSDETEELSDDESSGSDSESDDKVPSDDEITQVVMKALSGVAPNCDVAKDAASKLHAIIKRRRTSS